MYIEGSIDKITFISHYGYRDTKLYRVFEIILVSNTLYNYTSEIVVHFGSCKLGRYLV